MAQKQKTERKRKKEEEKKVGNNNGQLRIANATSGGACKAYWANCFQCTLLTERFCSFSYLRNIEHHRTSYSGKTVQQNQLSLFINDQPGPVGQWIAHGMEPLHGDGQGDEDGGGEGGVVQAVQYRQNGAKMRELGSRKLIKYYLK